MPRVCCVSGAQGAALGRTLASLDISGGYFGRRRRRAEAAESGVMYHDAAVAFLHVSSALEVDWGSERSRLDDVAPTLTGVIAVLDTDLYHIQPEMLRKRLILVDSL